MGDAALQALQIAATSLMNLGLALMLGALACAWLQRGGAAPAPHRIGRMAWALRAGTAVALLGAVMALWAESALMADVPLAEAGSTLTAVIGAWSPSASFAITWFAESSVITGQRGLQLKLTSSQLGKRIRVRVVALRPGYLPVARTSSFTTRVTR